MTCELKTSLVFFYMFSDSDLVDEADYIPQSKWKEFSEAAKLAMLFAAGISPIYGKANYLDLYSHSRAIYGNHPFREKTQGTVTFMGSHGISASIGPWLQYLCTHQEEVAEINLYECETEGKGQYTYYLEYVDKYEDAYICSGMTNFSGEGGSAFKTAMRIVKFVSFVTKCQINSYHVSGNWEAKVQKWLSRTATEEYTL
jgi:hypothetical protein